MAVHPSAPPPQLPFTDATSEWSEAAVEASNSLAATLAKEMAERWRRGERPVVEEFLSRHPVLREQPAAVAQLIYEEICLREEGGEEHSSVEVVQRFPQWQAQLRSLLWRRSTSPERLASDFPKVGEEVGGFRLVAELGHGARGRVFLATQADLADRPVVLKITTLDGGEHLSLARLQHTHIVPLYTVQEDQARNLRLLCMPYFGGATLAQLLDCLRDTPPSQRTGQQLVEALNQAQARLPETVPGRGPARQPLAQASYVQAVCWIGACLADALHYAHERGLVHLDIKPSNVLIAADGQPMLLDFHLARKPLSQDNASPEWLGGTPAFMSPEQLAALRAVHERRPIPIAVDGRSDIYSLGLLLLEALDGGSQLPREPGQPPGRARNPEVSVGLADVIAKCLRVKPDERYADTAMLAADLRRHLADLPLQGVPNRSLSERWSKWRRRRPLALRLVALTLGILVTGLTGVAVASWSWGQHEHAARNALSEGQTLREKKKYDEAVRTLSRGLDSVEGIPWTEQLQQDLCHELKLAKQAQAAQELHGLADEIRLRYTADSLWAEGQRDLNAACRKAWQERARITNALAELPPDDRQRIQNDLLDLAVLGADLRVQLAGPNEVAEARQEALEVLTQAEVLFGPSHILCRERQTHAEALGKTELAQAASAQADRLAPQSAWEHCALGRSLLNAGKTEEAAAAIRKAIELQPAGLWPNYYRGHCAYRLKHFQNAVNAFSVCVGAASKDESGASLAAVAGCFYNRARAYAALKQNDRALADYDHALKLDPQFGAAVVQRGILRHQQQRDDEALADLERALQLGVNPADVHYHQALVFKAKNDRASALASLRRALKIDPQHKEARALYDRLQQ